MWFTSPLVFVLSVEGLSRPSKIQTIAYPHVLAGTSCVIAEQTGSGKTLAYVLPLLQVRRTGVGLGREAVDLTT